MLKIIGYKAMKRPEIIVFSTISLDGGLSVRGMRTRLSSDNDLVRLHFFRYNVDAVMVGANTVIIDDPLLTIRYYSGESEKQPYRIVVDKDLRCSTNKRVFDTSIAPTIVITSREKIGDPKLLGFINRGVSIIFTNRIDHLLDLEYAVQVLFERYGIKRILVEGGGYLIGSLLRQRLVDKLIVTISPVLIGLNKTPLINIWLNDLIKLDLLEAYIDHSTGEVTLVYKPE